VSNLFHIEGVTEQREEQCSKCPDGPARILSEEEAAIIRARVKAHRCHETMDKLCAGPYRPRVLAGA
jgi:hypothetical protein